MSKRAYKFRLYPSEEQRGLLAKTFGCVRVVWNRTLRYRVDAYRSGGESIGCVGANAYLSAMKRDAELSWLREVSSIPLQQCLRHQQKAFTNFFAGRAGHPAYKRIDTLHKLTRRLIDENQVVCVESLAAKNIRAAGLAVLACGGGVRPAAGTGAGRLRRSRNP